MNSRIVLSTATLLVVGVLGYWLGQTTSEPQDQSDTNAEPQPLFYRNPMNPQVTSPIPAKDNMGMDYIPVFSESSTSSVPGTVRIDPVTIQSMGVRTTKTERRSIARNIYTVGRVDFNEKGIVRLHPKTEGWIEALMIETTGQTIKTDDILLNIYSPQLVATQQEYLLALANLEKIGSTANQGAIRGAENLVNVTLKRLQFLDVPKHQLDELESSRRVKKHLHIHSPASGTVISVGARKGQYVTPLTELYFIADLTSVWVFVDIFEDELPWVRAGDEAEAKIAGVPGVSFKGKLTYIYPYAERSTRTIKARLEFPNEDFMLKPDMFADVTIHAQPKADVIAVPAEAIIRSGLREKVFVVTEPGKFEPRDVSIGVTSEGWTEIIHGLTPDETVVVSAQFLIDSESKLREAASKMRSMESADKVEMDDAMEMQHHD
jgi:Cu(I)/Ag(I) efflux system membrane fusion protein